MAGQVPRGGARLLLTQTCTDVDVHLYVPAACARTNEAYVLTDKLLARAEREPRLSIRRIPTDYGPATKLLAPYEERGSADGRRRGSIITVDDDVLLEAHAIEELFDAHARHPEDALGFMGASDGTFVHAEQLTAQGVESRPTAILGGYRGVLYPMSVLDVSLFEDLQAVSALPALPRRRPPDRVEPGPSGARTTGDRHPPPRSDRRPELRVPRPSGPDHGRPRWRRADRPVAPVPDRALRGPGLAVAALGALSAAGARRPGSWGGPAPSGSSRP